MTALTVPATADPKVFADNIVAHDGHEVVRTIYAGENLALECEDCGVVIIDTYEEGFTDADVANYDGWAVLARARGGVRGVAAFLSRIEQ